MIILYIITTCINIITLILKLIIIIELLNMDIVFRNYSFNKNKNLFLYNNKDTVCINSKIIYMSNDFFLLKISEWST